MKYKDHKDWAAYKEFFTRQFGIEESYILCGAGKGAQVLAELFPAMNIRCCLDKNAAQVSMGEQDVFPYEILKSPGAAKQKFIITAGCEYYTEIRSVLLSYGVSESHICSLPEIFHFWGERYAGKMLTTVCNAILLTNCNLRCRSCSQFIPYAKRYRYNSAEDVIKNLDQYFHVFGYVKDLCLVGGETMLYKELGQVCKHVREYFPDRYHELKLFTNGLVVPKAGALEELSKLERVNVLISDYTCGVQKGPGGLIESLEKYQIPYTLNNSFGQSSEYQWFDFGDPAVRKEGEAAERFEKCSLACQHLIDRKIYYCAPSFGASIGNTTELDGPECCLDLSELEDLAPSERADQIGKFSLGFLDRGCLEFCKFCNGYGVDVNRRYVRAGEQC